MQPANMLTTTDPGDVYTVQGHVGPAAIEGRYS